MGIIDQDWFHVRTFISHEVPIHAWWKDRDVCSTYWRYYVNSRAGASIRLHADGSVFDLPPRMVHLVPAWVRFDLMPPANVVQHLYAHFDIVGLPGTLVREVFARPVSLPFDAPLRATAEAMRAAIAGADAARRPQAQFAAKAAIYAALAMLMSRLDPERSARISSALHPDSRLAPALQRIEADVALPLRVSALARDCGFAEAHFARRFRAELGQSPGQYLLERRVALAAQRLLLSDESIEDIAERCGFPDRFYFTRVFTRRMGVPPAAYRRGQPDLGGRRTRG
ncbi:MAG: helix-turn-helix transcriptional regulator [Planctomycetes bacterium]|nr:helix-turn-helix transcriptional regulator [Planctomycetota bacterium]